MLILRFLRSSVTPALFLTLAAAPLSGCQSEPESTVETPPTTGTASEGSPAPDFTLPTLDGETFTLSDHRGEVVVLNFWATWCMPCLAEMPELEEVHQELGDEGVQIVGISQDTGGTDEIRPFAAQLDVTYPLLPDPGFNVSSRYGGISVLPTTIVIDREGNIARTEIGSLTRSMLLDMIDDLIAPARLSDPSDGTVVEGAQPRGVGTE